MSNGKLRRQITFEAARLIYIRQESEYYRAKMTAARRLGQRRVKYADLPTNREIRDEIQSLARIGDAHPPGNGHDDREALGHNAHLDRFGVYRMLLVPLETVQQNLDRHPEGDALYHSLQVFDLARDALPYDEEFQVAALLHDVGKALVPVAILEKPGPLDPDEMAIMKKHPEYGVEALKSGVGLQPEMVDIVARHHEYLDGSGYPHGLQAHEISDLVRITTIVDVYSALIEQRAYRAPMPSQKAYDILLDMGPKLDQDLVRAFSIVSKAA